MLPRIVAAILVAVFAACARGGRRPSADELVLERQEQGLEALIRVAEKGPLVPFKDVLVIVDEGLVQEVLTAGTPFERVIAAKYRIQITAATVSFEDGFALVRLDGRARLAKGPASAAFADVSVFGALDIVELDPRSGFLHGRVKVIAFDARRVDVLGIDAALAERQVEKLGREKLEDFSALASAVDIPVRLEQVVTVPAVGPAGGIRIDAASVPLQAAVLDVVSFRGKLWISIGATVGRGPSPAGSR